MVIKQELANFAILLFIVIFAFYRTSDSFLQALESIWGFFSDPIHITWFSATMVFYGVLYREKSWILYFTKGVQCNNASLHNHMQSCVNNNMYSPGYKFLGFVQGFVQRKLTLFIRAEGSGMGSKGMANVVVWGL